MAQNLVLSWLAGGRIMELKTVQVNDELKISRPCIDATNVGYNVEWSQELRVADSLDQYVQGAMLIHMLRQAPEVFGHPFGDVSMAGTSGEPIYDMSIGYDLAGIQTPKVVELHSRHDRRPRKRGAAAGSNSPLARPAARARLPDALSRSITLSTFHGCPADEIERICEFLLTELDVHAIVKMNPPMLGKERLEHLLYDVMGYTELRVNREGVHIRPAIRRVAGDLRPADASWRRRAACSSGPSFPTRSKWRTIATSSSRAKRSCTSRARRCT